MNKKPVIVFDVASSKRGGPYVACKNIMSSSLNDEFEFREITYNNKLGRFISWRRIKDLKRQIEEINPDGIIINGLQLSCFHVCVAALLAKVKTRIITIHGSSIEALCLSRFKKSILYIIEYLSLMMSTSFYGVSKYASTLSASKFFRSKNCGHVYNLTTKPVKTPGLISRQSLRFEPTDIIVASSGRVIKEKGFEVLAKAVKAIDLPHVKFIILGDGDYLNEFKESLSTEVNAGRVVCTGFTSNVYDYLEISDIFVLPTLHETLSVSLLEASYARLPLVSCNVGGVPEVIESGYNGILVEPGNVEETAKAIIELATNKSVRHEMGANAEIRLRKFFSSQDSLEKLSKLIKSDLNRWKKD